eukprot:1214083-Pleurochrysis_carterae.AAC.2
MNFENCLEQTPNSVLSSYGQTLDQCNQRHLLLSHPFLSHAPYLSLSLAVCLSLSPSVSHAAPVSVVVPLSACLHLSLRCALASAPVPLSRA